jgi:predicted amidohydrolase YtcJ
MERSVVVVRGRIYRGLGRFAEAAAFSRGSTEPGTEGKCGVLLFVGSWTEFGAWRAARKIGENTPNGDEELDEVIAVPPGGVCLAAFHDPHAHPAGAGARLVGNSQREDVLSALRDVAGADAAGLLGGGRSNDPHALSLQDVHGPEAILTAVGARVKELAVGCNDPLCVAANRCTLTGVGVDRNVLAKAHRMRKRLDGLAQASGIRPCAIMLRDIGGHALVANSEAVAAVFGSGSESQTRAEPGDEDCQVEDGIFHGKWVARFFDLRPPSSSLGDSVSAICVGLREVRKAGICAITDAFAVRERLGAYLEVSSRYGATLPRVQLAMGFRSDDDPRSVLTGVCRDFPELTNTSPSALVSLVEGKLEIDGAFSLSTAWSSVPYAVTTPENCGGIMGLETTTGRPRVSHAQIRRFVEACQEFGLTTHMHVTGDLAGAAGANALTDTHNSHPSGRTPVGMHKLAHMQHFDSRLINGGLNALVRNGVAAVLTPAWFTNDTAVVKRMPSSAHRHVMPIGELAAAGVTVCFASDWDVTTLHPLVGIECAVRRRMLPGLPAARALDVTIQQEVPQTSDPRDRHVFREADCVGVADAVDMYTVHAAKAMGMGALSGSVDVDLEASLIILDLDIFKCDASDIHCAQIVRFFLRGVAI